MLYLLKLCFSINVGDGVLDVQIKNIVFFHKLLKIYCKIPHPVIIYIV